MATITHARSQHLHRPRRRAQAITPQEYEDIRDCCCHKLGRARPHPAFACRDLD